MQVSRLFTSLLLLVCVSAVSRADVVDALVPEKEIQIAADLIRDHRFGEAVIDHLNPIIAEFEKQHADPEVQVYCSSSPEETLFYMMYFTTHGRKGCRKAVCVGSAYATAYFLKGYILNEQRNYDKATPLVEKAVELSPYCANFLNELAHLYQVRKDWDRAMGVFDQAVEAAKAFDKRGGTENLRRALRGKAYVLVELRRLDEAEAIYGECLKLDATDERAKSELQYVGQLRASIR